MARLIGMDPVEFRRKNMIGPDFIEPTTEKPIQSYALEDVIAAAEKASGYAAKKEENRLFNEAMEKAGKPRAGESAWLLYPIIRSRGRVYWIRLRQCSPSIRTDRLYCSQAQRKSDRAATACFLQIAAEAIGVSFDKIHILSNQDTGCYPVRYRRLFLPPDI